MGVNSGGGAFRRKRHRDATKTGALREHWDRNKEFETQCHQWIRGWKIGLKMTDTPFKFPVAFKFEVVRKIYSISLSLSTRSFPTMNDLYKYNQ